MKIDFWTLSAVTSMSSRVFLSSGPSFARALGVAPVREGLLGAFFAAFFFVVFLAAFLVVRFAAFFFVGFFLAIALLSLSGALRAV